MVLAPTTALMLYLCMTLFVILSLWFWNHLQVKKRIILPPKDHLIICEYCHTAYVSPADKEIAKCPECQSFNRSY